LDIEGESGGQSMHREVDGLEVKGMGTVDREVLAEVGWEDISVWE
jgi:hypothetical protein